MNIKGKLHYLWLVFIVIITLIIYSHTSRNHFLVWDDDNNIYNNSDITTLSLKSIGKFFTNSYVGMYQPFTTLTFAINYKISGLKANAYSMTNLLFHLLNILLVFQFIMMLTKRKEVGLIAAWLFAVHPMHVESICWISERKDVLFAFFFLLSLIFYVKYIETKFRLSKYVWCLVFFACSLLSKSAAMTLPFILILTDYYMGRKINKKSLVEKLPFFLLFLAFGIVSYMTQLSSGDEVYNAHNSYNLFDKPLLVAYSVFFYLLRLIFPFRLSAIYPYPDKSGDFLPQDYYIAMAVVIALVILFFILYKRVSTEKRHDLVWGIGFFIFNILLIIQIIPLPSYAITADRYTYLPYLGFFLIIGKLYTYLDNSRKGNQLRFAFKVIFVIFSIFFVFSSYDRNKVWGNSFTLFNDVITKHPNSILAYNNRGMAKVNAGDIQGALEDFNHAIQINPNVSVTYSNRGGARHDIGDYKGAIEDFTHVINFRPKYVLAYYNRGLAKMNSNDAQGALADYSKAIEINPKYAEAYNNRGNTRVALHDDMGALSDYNMAISLRQDYVEAYYNRGNTRMKLLDYKHALEDYNSAVKLNPGYIDAINNRGTTRMNLSDFTGAIEDFTRVIQLNPSFIYAYNNRGLAEINTHDLKSALEDFNTAISQNSKYLYAYNNRGSVKNMLSDFKGAIGDFFMAISLNPDFPDPWFNKGLSELQLKLTKEACADFHQALKLGYQPASEYIAKNCK